MKDYTEYISFSAYLKDYFEERKTKNPAFSARAFAQFLGFKNPTLVNDILRDKRKPTLAIAVNLCRKSFFPKHQTDYLVKICEYERAKNFEERNLIMAQLRKLLVHKKWKVYDLNQYDFMTHPHVLLVYSLIALKDFKPTLAYINRRLKFELTQGQLTNALGVLLRLKHIRSGPSGGYEYSNANSVLASGDASVNSEVTKNFHLNMMKLVQELYVDLPAHERDVRSTTLAIKKDDFKMITDEIKSAHIKISDYGIDTEADEVYVFLSQLIPVSKDISS